MRIIFLVCCLVLGLGMIYYVNWEEDTTPPPILFKIVSPEDWARSQQEGEVALTPIDKDFIHLATEDQIPHVVGKFWSKANSYVVLKLDVSALRGTLKYETNPGGETKYYHLYHGSIPLKAVLESNTIKNS